MVCSRPAAALLAPLVALSLLLTLIVRPASAETLPNDPALVTGELENGLRYVVRKHSNPPGRAVIWIHMHTGSLNETTKQDGIAHYLEHMAFNGSENFEPGSLVPFFQSLGMQFGRDQNAFTNINQTTYQLSLPNVEEATLNKGLTFFADVVGRLSLSPKEIDAERGIIQEERRRSLGGRQRVADYIRQKVYAGSKLAVHDTIGTEESINGLQREDFLDYYNKWYGASNATLMVVADAEPQQIIGLIEKSFGSLPKKPRPTSDDIGLKPYDKSFAVIGSDPEIRSEEIAISKIAAPKPATTTTEGLRQDLVQQLGESAMNRRFSDKVSAGGTAYTSARASASNNVGVIYETEFSVRAHAGKWKEATEAAAMELQRARKFGFNEAEIELAKKEILSAAEWAVETAPSATAQALVGRMNGGVTDGEPIMSPQQRLDVLKKILPEIKTEEISAAFATEFDFPVAAVVGRFPGGSQIPSESDLLSVGLGALKVEPTKGDDVTYAASLLKNLPTAGTIVDGEEHAASGVWSGWLSNNVRVNHRFMDHDKNQVTIQISLIGGEMLETAENRGITQAAQLAFARPATNSLSSIDIRNLMAGKKVNVRGGGGGGGGRGRGGGGGGFGGRSDAISLTVTGAPEELEPGMQLAYLLLTEPKIEPAAFEMYQTSFKETYQEMSRNPAALGMRLSGAAPYPDSEARTQPVTIEQVEHLSLPAAQAWLEQTVREAPIEVTVVGDIQREKAMDLVAKYIGAIPSRQKIQPNMFADKRAIQRPAGPRLVERSVETPTPQAFVSSGFYGADETNRQDVRVLNMAARILSTRMVKEVREEGQLVYSIGASSRPSSTYPGFGVFGAAAPTDPGKADALVKKLSEMYETFAKEGPTADELTVAKKQFENTFVEQVKEPSYWLGRMNLMTYRGTNLDEALSDPAAYQQMTAEEVKNTFAKYWAKENGITVVVRPAAKQ